jgi:hypothetical protein
MACGGGFPLPVAAAYRDIALGATPMLVYAGMSSILWIDAHAATADQCIQLFDAASAGDVSVGTTVAAYTFFIDNGIGRLISVPMPIPFALGIVVASTTTRTGSSTGGSTSIEIVYSKQR